MSIEKLIPDYNLHNLSDRELLIVSIGAVNALGEKYSGLESSVREMKMDSKNMKDSVDKVNMKLFKIGLVALVFSSLFGMFQPDIASIISKVSPI